MEFLKGLVFGVGIMVLYIVVESILGRLDRIEAFLRAVAGQ